MNSAQERIDATTRRDPKAMLVSRLEAPSMLDFIRSVAPGLDPLGVVRVAFAHVQASPHLSRCSVQSIVTAVAEAAKLGLTVDGTLGHAYLVPFRSEAKMMVGYRGIEHLAYESGKVTRFHADTVHAHDTFEYAEGTTVHFLHQRAPLGTPRGEIRGAYATAHLAAGGPPLIVVMDMDEIYARRDRSASWKRDPKKSPWSTDELAMIRKTPIRELGKRTPDPKIQSVALRDEARDEGRHVPETIDLGAAEEVAACPKCESLHLRADGTCPDCEPQVVA